MKNRAVRRHHINRLKKKFRKIAKHIWKYTDPPDEKNLGMVVSTHGKQCSCTACGNPRKHFKQKTLQEKREEQDDKSDG